MLLYLNARKSNSGRLQLLHRTVSLYNDLMKSTVMLKNVKFKMFTGNLFKAVTNLYILKFR